jgi:hypothetical protein
MPIDTAHVKSGLNNRETVVACRCINVGLFVSDELRRDVEVSLCIGNDADLRIISLSGESIRRVSPDERSISFFLLKAMQSLDGMALGTVKSTDNGIVLCRTDSENLVASWSTGLVHVADSSIQTTNWNSVSTGGLFVYDMSDVLSRSFASSSALLLHRPPNPERFILDVNMHCDMLETSLLKKAS